MAPTPQQDPTMEEILASIRKIISEDASAKAAPAEAVQPSPAAPAPVTAPEPESPAPSEDILELTEVVDTPLEDTSAQETPTLNDDIEFSNSHYDEPVAPVQDEAAVSLDNPFADAEPQDTAQDISAEEPASESGDDSLFSEKSRNALDDALSGIEDAIDEPTKDEPGAPIPAGGERELGAIILNAVRAKVDPTVTQWLDANRDELIQHIKPIIREWLDETFPAVLADAVRDEVARAVKLRGIKR